MALGVRDTLLSTACNAGFLRNLLVTYRTLHAILRMETPRDYLETLYFHTPLGWVFLSVITPGNIPTALSKMRLKSFICS